MPGSRRGVHFTFARKKQRDGRTIRKCRSFPTSTRSSRPRTRACSCRVRWCSTNSRIPCTARCRRSCSARPRHQEDAGRGGRRGRPGDRGVQEGVNVRLTTPPRYAFGKRALPHRPGLPALRGGGSGVGGLCIGSAAIDFQMPKIAMKHSVRGAHISTDRSLLLASSPIPRLVVSA